MSGDGDDETTATTFAPEGEGLLQRVSAVEFTPSLAFPPQAGEGIRMAR